MVVHSSTVSSSRQDAISSIFKFLNVKPDPWRLECLAHANLDYFKVEVLWLNLFEKVRFFRENQEGFREVPMMLLLSLNLMEKLRW